MSSCATLAAILACFSFETVHADELTRQLQEELRRRYLYFGEIDGRSSEELVAAMKSYQRRKGLPISGAADEGTIGSLGLHNAHRQVAAGPHLPDVPILRSDAAREISATDREFLRNLEEGDARLPAPEAAAPEEPPTPVAAAPDRIAEAEDFIRNYLIAAQAADPAGELDYFADGVDYFDHGKVNHAFIERDVRRYHKRWTERKFTLLRIEAKPISATDVAVDFRIRFNLKGKGESATGQTDNTFKVRRTGDGLKLIQLKEKRVRS